jgi:hypothetical protein
MRKPFDPIVFLSSAAMVSRTAETLSPRNPRHRSGRAEQIVFEMHEESVQEAG